MFKQHPEARSSAALRLAAPLSFLRRVARHRATVVASAAIALIGVAAVASGVVLPATASASAPTALVYGPSVSSSPSCSTHIPFASFKPATGGATPCGEVADLQAQGWNVTVATQSQWDAMSGSQFASYQLLVLGDPTCGSASAISGAVSNEATWAPQVNGTMIVIGTDPIYHERSYPGSGQTTPDPAKLVYQGLAYAGGQAGRTGLYLDLSCYYQSGSNADAPILDGLESGFRLSGAGCTSAIHVVAAAQQLIGVTDADLSNWGCSTHEYFTSWPSDFVPYVLDTTDTCPSPYSPPDGSASGCPYIVARGGGISAGGVTLTAPTAGGIGTNQTLTAAVELDGSPVSGASVTLTCTSGACLGTTMNLTTDSNGNATYTYSSATPGTDVWQASYTPSGGSTTTSNASVVWNRASTSLNASATPSSAAYGNTVSLGATGLPSPATGTVGFVSGGTLCSASVASGSALCATGVLAPGSYSVIATYSGDAFYFGSTGSTSFTITTADGTPSTAVYDAAHSAAWGGAETLGASAYDTASVASSGSGATPTGTLTYYLYNGSACSGVTVSSNLVALSGGNVPSSPATAPLPPGTYSYQAVYSGDSDYAAGTSSCQAFTVAKGAPALMASVDDATTASAWSGSEQDGATAYDTATLTSVSGFTPSGTVTYHLYDNGDCLGSPLSSEDVTLAGGAVPDSSATSALAAGTYGYQASYSGDAYYTPATGDCMAFTVKAPPAPAPTPPPVSTRASNGAGPPSADVVIAGLKVTAGSGGGAGGSGGGSGAGSNGPSNGSATASKMVVMSGQVVDAHYSCQDAAGGPGIASCVGTVANGAALDTKTVGVHTFTVTSTSADGQTSTKTIEYEVIPTNYFTVRHVVVHPDPESGTGQPDTDRDGIVAFDLNLPGAGKVSVLETAPPKTAAGVATAGAQHRVVYATAQMTAGHAQTLKVEISPNAVGSRLVAEHPNHLWLQIVVTFKPTRGKARTEVFYGINASLEPAKSAS